MLVAPQEAIKVLIDDVNELVPEIFSQANADSLTVKLEATIQHLDNGRINAACHKLQDFINQVNALTSDGEDLIDLANQIRSELNC